MLRKVFAATAVAAALTIASALPASASASASASSGSDPEICLAVNLLGLCLDAPALSQQLQVDAGNSYDVDEIGTVSAQEEEPFTPGSGWNARYAGSAVVVLDPESDLDACARTDDVTNPNASAVYNAAGSGCNIALKPTAIWVERGNWLVNVGQTDQGPSSGVPYILQAGCASKGCSVWVNTAAANGNPSNYQWDY
jgi:hypothetical protein